MKESGPKQRLIALALQVEAGWAAMNAARRACRLKEPLNKAEIVRVRLVGDPDWITGVVHSASPNGKSIIFRTEDDDMFPGAIRLFIDYDAQTVFDRKGKEYEIKRLTASKA